MPGKRVSSAQLPIIETFPELVPRSRLIPNLDPVDGPAWDPSFIKQRHLSEHVYLFRPRSLSFFFWSTKKRLVDLPRA